MPTYKNTTNIQVTVDDYVFRPYEEREISHYLIDDDGVLELLSDTPYDNPILFDGSFSGIADGTAIFSVSLEAKSILLEASGPAEFYRNDMTNTPPLILTDSRIYVVDNHRDMVRGIIKYLGPVSVKVTILGRD